MLPVSVTISRRFICRIRQFKQSLEKPPALALEKSRIGQKFSRRHGSSKPNGSRPNDRAERQVRADEFARPGHDQVRRGGRIGVQIREYQPVSAVDRRRVSDLVVPNLEMRDFRAFDAGDDAKGQKAVAFETECVV